MNQRSVYLVLLGGTMAWCAAIVLAPLLAQAHPLVAGTIYRFFLPFCHHDPARCFIVEGHPVAVCIRCSSIYGGFLAGVLLSPFVRPRFLVRAAAVWSVAVFPMLADVLLDLIRVHASSTAGRMATGLWFGVLAALILTPVILGASSAFFRSTTVTPEHTL